MKIDYQKVQAHRSLISSRTDSFSDEIRLLAILTELVCILDWKHSPSITTHKYGMVVVFYNKRLSKVEVEEHTILLANYGWQMCSKPIGALRQRIRCMLGRSMNVW